MFFSFLKESFEYFLTQNSEPFCSIEVLFKEKNRKNLKVKRFYFLNILLLAAQALKMTKL